MQTWKGSIPVYFYSFLALLFLSKKNEKISVDY